MTGVLREIPLVEPIMTVHSVTINAADPSGLAHFLARLVGGTPTDSGNNFILLDPGDNRQRLLFQQTDQTNHAPGWIHLDCSTKDRDALIEAVIAGGGRLVDRRSDSLGSWIVLADPEGNLFCA